MKSVGRHQAQYRYIEITAIKKTPKTKNPPTTTKPQNKTKLTKQTSKQKNLTKNKPNQANKIQKQNTRTSYFLIYLENQHSRSYLTGT